MKGKAGQIISDDGEVILCIQVGDAKSYKNMCLKHEENHVCLVHNRPYIQLRQLKIQIGKWKLAIQINI